MNNVINLFIIPLQQSMYTDKINTRKGSFLYDLTGIRYITIILLLFTTNSCKINYSFTGATFSSEIQTISVQYFPNYSKLIQPTLSQTFTEALKDKFQSQTNFQFVNDIGDVNFEGEIREYRTQPIAISGNETAALNRLTITIRVKYTNSVEPDNSFDSSFSRYADYDSSSILDDVEDELITEIIEQIIDDIYNRAFVNW